MERFLEKILKEKSDSGDGNPKGKDRGPENNLLSQETRKKLIKGEGARIAVYDTPSSAPRVIELSHDDYQEFINILSTKTYQFSQEKGGGVPFTIIKELIENLIHAHFKEVIITILDNGNTIKISDQGPGIKDKEKAFEPGFSTANQEMKKIIKGVGSGLPITKEILKITGGSIKIEDNLNTGSVVTIKLPSTPSLATKSMPADTPKAKTSKESDSSKFNLSNRQKKVLFLVTEVGPVGPSKIAKELNLGLSTAYRDLSFLEELGLVKANEQGKRGLTQKGIRYLEIFLNSK
ncbi:ATP-binding protein [Candidatus Oleimmundimicrobium sp.]|uniref:ATP-binding protein n=1 Tax=Candidatus Oleimmundimicrobium sp. TaxID=3060597 RepID=UPI002717013B|nr:ATP-binding protein [Candidatus Oleimmundimicrobium sp.]MDO8886381.1 ATP-binding protein [Candidatus Oleimmundimicrobium sp.]